jgi:tRNA dimethylallyltransferase
MNRVLLIMGPTASGKSALALELAERLSGEIVNTDSKQVYRGLRVLTARPSATDEERAPHHLYGFVEPDEVFSAGKWAPWALHAIRDIEARGKTPILVGGSGLYFKALTEGLAPTPSAPDDVRARYREELAAQGPEAMHKRLATLDPECAARIAPADSVRVLRALEIVERTGMPLAKLRAMAKPALAPGSWRGLALLPDRRFLYEAIDQRFADMLKRGAAAEVEAFLTRGLDPELPAMKAHGLPWLAKHLRGEMSLIDAAAYACRDTRHYAKRQTTWILGQMASWPRLDDTGLNERLKAVAQLLQR